MWGNGSGSFTFLVATASVCTFLVLGSTDKRPLPKTRGSDAIAPMNCSQRDTKPLAGQPRAGSSRTRLGRVTLTRTQLKVGTTAH